MLLWTVAFLGVCSSMKDIKHSALAGNESDIDIEKYRIEIIFEIS